MNRRSPSSNTPSRRNNTRASQAVRTARTKTPAPHSDSPSTKNLKGAVASKHSLIDDMASWLRHHRRSCNDSLRRLFNAPWQSLLTALMISIALVLPVILFLGLSNVQQIGQGWQQQTQMSAYITVGTKPLAIEQLQQRLQTSGQLDAITLITPEQAKLEFQQHSGLGDIVDSLDNNPLPAVLLLTPATEIAQPKQLQLLQQRLQAEPLIDAVQLDIEWLQRLQQMMELAQRLVLMLALLLGLGVWLIIGNTIRLAIENRREEIIVAKLVGATNGFVRRPFLYTGFWYGCLGGLVAISLLIAIGFWLEEPIAELLSLYESQQVLIWLDITIGFITLSASALIGWLGAWLAVARHLRQIEPS